MTNQVPPGPQSKFLGLDQLSKFQPDQLMKTFEEYARTYGDVVRIRLGGFQHFLVFHPDHVRQILVDEPETVCKSKFQTRLLSVFHGNSLINSDGEFWKRQRKLVQPAFHTKRIQTYAEKMAEYTARTMQSWQVGATYDIADEMMNLTLSIVCDTLFGVDVKETANRIEEAVTIVENLVMRKAPALLPLPLWVPTRQHRNARRAIRELRSLVMGFIGARRASGEDRGDLLSMLLLAIDDEKEQGGGQMTDIQARDEAISLLIVGHETSASALAWTFYEIAQNPEVEAKLVMELDTVLAGRAPTMQDMRQLKYLDMVIKESLRLHPPSWATIRDAAQDIKLGGYIIPKGSSIDICQHVMHRDPRWFPEPERFLPERFGEGWENNLPKGAYMPFGVGPHNCIGQVFAMMEIHIILALTLQRYHLALVPGQEIVPLLLISQCPRDGVQVTIALRQPSPALA